MTKKTATLTSVILATFLLGLSAVGGWLKSSRWGFSSPASARAMAPT